MIRIVARFLRYQFRSSPPSAAVRRHQAIVELTPPIFAGYSPQRHFRKPSEPRPAVFPVAFPRKRRQSFGL